MTERSPTALTLWALVRYQIYRNSVPTLLQLQQRVMTAIRTIIQQILFEGWIYFETLLPSVI